MVTKKRRKKTDRTPYSNTGNSNNNSNKDIGGTLKLLGNIAVMEPGNNAQIAAKKIAEKYKKLRSKKKQAADSTADKKVLIQEPEEIIIETKEPVVASSKILSIKTANKIKDKYLKIRREKSKKLTDQHKKDKPVKVIDAITDVNKASDKKQKKIAAEKILKKYKNLKKPKKTYLVKETNVKTIDYLSPNEDIYAGESIVNATNKVFDYNKFTKEDGFSGQSILKKANKAYNKDKLAESVSGQSILNKANKIFNFKQSREEQVQKIQEYNDELLNETAETINYVDDLNMDDVKDCR